MTPRRKERQRCYVLHWEDLQGHILHYAGIALLRRLDARLDEHKRGHGGKASEALFNQGYRVLHVQLIPHGNLAQERILRVSPQTKLLCDLCNIGRKALSRQSSAPEDPLFTCE